MQLPARGFKPTTFIQTILITFCRVAVLRPASWVVQQWRSLVNRTRPARHTVGQGLVEYALILVLIAIVVIGALTVLGKQTSQVYDEVVCGLEGGEYHSDNGQGNSNRCR